MMVMWGLFLWYACNIAKHTADRPAVSCMVNYVIHKRYYTLKIIQQKSKSWIEKIYRYTYVLEKMPIKLFQISTNRLTVTQSIIF